LQHFILPWLLGKHGNNRIHPIYCRVTQGAKVSETLAVVPGVFTNENGANYANASSVLHIEIMPLSELDKISTGFTIDT
jgi:hypothetical protein